MKFLRPSLLAVALASAFPAMAQSNADLLKELQSLKGRIADLEQKLADKPTQPQWGMTPEQSAEFNRIAVKTEALQDNFTDQGYKGLKVSGYMEPVFIWNKGQNRAGFQFLNQQSDGFAYDTSFMGTAAIDFTKETESGTIWKLTLAPNRGVGAAIDGMSIVQEATVSVPLGDLQTRLIAGQIPDWSGYEYQQPTLNPFTSHNLLYDFTLPIGYTGVGMDIKDGKWWYRGAVGNVNSTIKASGQKAPMLAYRVDYAKGEFNGFGFAGMHGKAANFNLDGGATTAHLFEVDGYFTRGDWTFQGQLSYGQQKQAAIAPDADGNLRDARWVGVSGLMGYMFTPRLQGLVRADYINNAKNGGGLFGYTGVQDVDAGVYADTRNGIGATAEDPDRGANRYALTVGLKYAFDTATTMKVEYRYDGADRAVFDDVKSGTLKKNNQMLATSLVVAF